MAYIKCENVSLAYEGQTVVSDLNFEVNKGDYLCIVGENGSGKSTLVKAILGLKNANSGKITFGDGLGRKEIGYLPQQTIVQKDFPAIVEEIVLSGCINRLGFRPFYSAKNRKKARHNMELMKIDNLKNESYQNLSGGQQQRVSIGRALINAPALVLADEPTGNLDSKSSQEIMELLKYSNKKYGQTLIVITHDENIALQADRIIRIADGQIVSDEKTH